MSYAALAATLTLLGAVGTASAGMRNFMAVINSGQEVPQTNSNAFGVGFFTLDGDTNMLCYSISYSANDLLAPESDSHIHGPASPGVDGGIVFSLPLGSPKMGCVGPLGSAQRLALRKGQLYVNVHTTMNPGGEIRGQIIPVRGN
jgi:hypothetical protein